MIRRNGLLGTIILAASVLTVVFGCASTTQSVTQEDTLSTLQPSYCIALSGGGIRSGAVSLGVLQELQHSGVLSEAQYISAVSGGGYPLYGILTRMIVDKVDANSLLAEESGFIKRNDEVSHIFSASADLWKKALLPLDILVDQLPGHLEYVTLSDVFKGNLASDNYVIPSLLSNDYGSNIQESFGGFEKYESSPKYKLSLFELQIPKGFPIPIFLASQSIGRNAVENSDTYESRDIFELSPSWLGSEATGYWRDYTRKLTLLDAVVISAAAVDAPSSVSERVVPNWLKKIGLSLGMSIGTPSRGPVFLSDGGFIENQGVLALLRRNCREILAVDASFDPEVSLDGWKKLEQDSKQFGWSVPVPAQMLDQRATPTSAWELRTHVWHTTARTQKSTTQIYVLKLGLVSEATDQYDREIRDFVEQNHNSPDFLSVIKCNEKSAIERRCAFPVESTGRQSFSSEEFRAYRKLGKHMARRYLEETRGAAGDTYDQ